MIRLLSPLFIGAVFGLGIALSGMANPAKVLNFFDVFGTWDPSLMFVMGGALLTAAIGYRLVFARQPKPILGDRFQLPLSSRIDRKLIAGSATFGVGWGIAGFCPGGAVPALGLGHGQTIVFVVAMACGIVLAKLISGLFTSAK